MVPHHGSKTSSTSGFVAAVAPQRALVQAGYRNRFGHPAAAVLSRYGAHGVVVARSDHCGAWQWSSNEAIAAARCERVAAARYWHYRVTDGQRFRSSPSSRR
jgi:competence protein ComEC